MFDEIARGNSLMCQVAAVIRKDISFHEWGIYFYATCPRSNNWRKLVATLAHLDQELALLDDKIKRECEGRR